MRILFLGDIVGRSGREAVEARLPELRRILAVDLAVVNAENASHGFGLAPAMADSLFAAGCDVLTLGNHAWDRRELIGHIGGAPRIVRPLNFPPGTPVPAACGCRCPPAGGRVMGRLFMDALDDPFRLTGELLSRHRLGATVSAIVVDFHAEATSEKNAFAHHLDGRVSLVVGTHTHAPTADHRILPGGTAFQADAGMCGDYDSVIGMNKDGATARFVRKMPGERLQPADGEATICGLLVETDDRTGLALTVGPLRLGGTLSPAMPGPAQGSGQA